MKLGKEYAVKRTSIKLSSPLFFLSVKSFSSSEFFHFDLNVGEYDESIREIIT